MLDLGLGAALLDALPRSHPCQLVLVGARLEDSPRPEDSLENNPAQQPWLAWRAAASTESSAGAAGRAAARAPAPAGPGGLAWVFCSGVCMRIRRHNQREALRAAGSSPVLTLLNGVRLSK